MRPRIVGVVEERQQKPWAGNLLEGVARGCRWRACTEARRGQKEPSRSGRRYRVGTACSAAGQRIDRSCPCYLLERDGPPGRREQVAGCGLTDSGGGVAESEPVLSRAAGIDTLWIVLVPAIALPESKSGDPLQGAARAQSPARPGTLASASWGPKHSADAPQMDSRLQKTAPNHYPGAAQQATSMCPSAKERTVSAGQGALPH